MSTSVKIHITGRVQGVWYRVSARNKAQSLGLCGIVKNLPDGSVYAEAEGDQIQVDAFIKWCHEGPPGARVEGVRVEEQEAKGYRGFEIRDS